LAELALLLACRRRLDPSAPNGDYLGLLDLVTDVSGRRSHRDLIARHPRSLWMYGPICAALRLWGREDPELRWMVSQAVSAGYPVHWERLPYRYLDYLHFLDLAGFPHYLESLGDAYRYTLLASSPNALELTEDDAYTITHTVFYMTDFGLRRPPWPASFDPTRASELVEDLLRHYRVQEQSDLVAELIICAACLGNDPAGELSQAWRHLLHHQAPDGAVQTPEHLVGGPSLEGRPEGEQRWMRCYHTTTMVAVAALVSRHALGNSDVGAAGHHRPLAPARASRPAPDPVGGLARGAAWLRGQTDLAKPADAIVAAAGASAGLSVDGGRFDAAVGPALSAVAARVEALGDVGPVLPSGEMDLVQPLVSALQELAVPAPSLDRILRENDYEPGADLVQDTDRLAGGPDGGRIDATRARALMLLALGAHGGVTGSETDEAAASQSPEVPTEILDHLGSELIRARHDYRIGDAGLILCVLILGSRHRRLVRDGVETLLGQQRMDGSFGYSARSDQADDAERHTRLVWTARVVWALSCYCRPDLFCRRWSLPQPGEWVRAAWCPDP
jgi:hypothetical protein